MSYDESGYWPECGGHQWKAGRGPLSACARSGCGLYYSHWSGDRCPKAPDCTAVRGDVQCDREQGHGGEHQATVVWSDAGVTA